MDKDLFEAIAEAREAFEELKRFARRGGANQETSKAIMDAVTAIQIDLGMAQRLEMENKEAK